MDYGDMCALFGVIAWLAESHSGSAGEPAINGVGPVVLANCLEEAWNHLECALAHLGSGMLGIRIFTKTTNFLDSKDCLCVPSKAHIDTHTSTNTHTNTSHITHHPTHNNTITNSPQRHSDPMPISSTVAPLLPGLHSWNPGVYYYLRDYNRTSMDRENVPSVKSVINLTVQEYPSQPPFAGYLGGGSTCKTGVGCSQRLGSSRQPLGDARDLHLPINFVRYTLRSPKEAFGVVL